MSARIVALLKEEIDAEVDPFGKFEEVKVRKIVDIKISSIDKK